MQPNTDTTAVERHEETLIIDVSGRTRSECLDKVMRVARFWYPTGPLCATRMHAHYTWDTFNVTVHVSLTEGTPLELIRNSH